MTRRNEIQTWSRPFPPDRFYLKNKAQKLVRRYEGNPILTSGDVPYSSHTIFNGAVATFKGRTVLLFRNENEAGLSSLGLAWSDDGIHFEVERKPAMLPGNRSHLERWEQLGISDPRITKIGNTYYINYTGYSDLGVHPLLAKTHDFKTFKRITLLSLPDNRNVVLFPEKINGQYVRLDRPMAESHHGSNGIWISTSPDLIHWGNHDYIMGPRTCHWDCLKVGPGVPPIKTKKGWLEIYHGVRKFGAGHYRIGCVLLDLKHPAKVLGRAIPYILSPVQLYERVGDVGNVIFINGAVLESDNKTLRLYYAGADSCMCLAYANVGELVDLCLENPSAV
ncbi:MAG: glycoside hydrolase family 130 protein [Verrucomicrobia bacterium]|nr:glycoside hydrolase family 130 protein [Verrucomicrobiota bacterium]MBU1735314.1 glycoside hydrolase family 130 protein [Verrucomicrobiota bacterium]MBU1858167.1 glycoside hydrolase family 130 protein [Verrucomicrobiota bacterium]